MGDIGPETRWEEALAGVTSIIHLAGRAHVLNRRSASDEEQFKHVNVDGLEQMARSAARMGVRRIVLLSSVAVLGSKTRRGNPFNERFPPAPDGAYARSKWEGEQRLQRIAQETGIETVIVRPPLVYGPGAPGNFFRLVRWAASGIPLPLAAIDNRRSFIFVENLCDALTRATTSPAASGKVFLVSDGEDFSTAQWTRRVAKGLGRRARLFPLPSHVIRLGLCLLGRANMADKLLESLQIDSGLIREVLGWKPPWPVEEGLRRTFAEE